jgi:hypothetical protein
MAIRGNGKTSEEYILNAFTYTYSDWGHNYMSKKLYCIFFELTQAFYKHHRKTHNDEQIYMELKNIK